MNLLLTTKKWNRKGKKMKLLVKNISKHIGKKEILKDISIDLKVEKFMDLWEKMVQERLCFLERYQD